MKTVKLKDLFGQPVSFTFITLIMNQKIVKKSLMFRWGYTNNLFGLQQKQIISQVFLENLRKKLDFWSQLLFLAINKLDFILILHTDYSVLRDTILTRDRCMTSQVFLFGEQLT